MIHTGMQRLSNIMTLWLLSIAAFCSCDQGPIYSDKTEKTVIINGAVSDLSSTDPIEGVKVIFNAYAGNGERSALNTQNVYTDSKGAFNIIAEKIDQAVTCVITTEHEEYVSERKEIIVNWSGISYDEKRSTFFVNDCDFHLEKK